MTLAGRLRRFGKRVGALVGECVGVCVGFGVGYNVGMVVGIFDGRDEDAIVQARREWKRMKAAGHAVTYWQQNDKGRWEKKAESAAR